MTLVTVATNAFFAAGSPIWMTQNYAVIPMALSSLAAAIFVSVRAVQLAAVAIQLAMWIWYFAALQPPLSG